MLIIIYNDYIIREICNRNNAFLILVAMVTIICLLIFTETFNFNSRMHRHLYLK